MLSIRFSGRAFFSLVVFAVAIPAAFANDQLPVLAGTTQSTSSAQLGKLGTVKFPTTCSVEAQPHFLRGVAALHSFWYPVALDAFRIATQLDSNCMMGYWGEAMAHNHPLWGDPQETEKARNVIQKIIFTPDLTTRERSWLNAVKILYGEGDKITRDKAYAAAMKKIYRDYPDDNEAALFYVLALMGTVRSGDPTGVKTRLRAGEIAKAVYQKKPNHPGAAHYVIHAYDDPEHAHLALDAARRYAEIAPAAPHALHMPSHIFLQLGMWEEAAASNEASWAASVEWVKQNNLPINKRYYHSLYWLMYVSLQQGRYNKAQEMLMLMEESLTQFPKDNSRELLLGHLTHAEMAATFVVETERWEDANQLLPPAKTNNEKTQSNVTANLMQAYGDLAKTPAIFAYGMAAAERDSPGAQESMNQLQAIREKASGAKEPFIAELIKLAKIQMLEIEALIAISKNKYDDAIKIVRKATAEEEAMLPPSGPPSLIKPSHELFGEILLSAGHPNEAAEQFAISLHRHQNRTRSLLGAARAAARSGNAKDAVNFYAKFARQWQQADAQYPELREAQDYLKQLEARIKALMR